MIIITRAKKEVLSPLALTFFCMLLLFLLFYFLKSPSLAAASVRAALGVCAGSLIPSLFPFTVLVLMLNGSGISARISGMIGRPISWIFGIGKNAASAIFLGALGGFPIGAVCARSLYERGELSREDAARLISFTNNASPAFCIGAIGVSFFGNAKFGVMLYFAQLSAAIIIGTAQRGHRAVQSPHSLTAMNKSISDTVSTAIYEGGLTMLKLCSFAVFFAVVGDCTCTVISRYFGDTIAALCVSVTEVTFAARQCASIGGITAKIICAFAVGFSGFSVHMQTASVLSSSGIPMLRYYIAKAFQGMLCAGIMLVLAPFYS